MTTTTPQHDVVIIGAGFSGLYAIHRLRDELGLDVVTYEAGKSVGGTWYWNRYPGARCDSESYYYSYSFSEELQQEWTWSSRYPGQPEILRYLDHVADRFDLRRTIQFETKVTRAEFIEDADQWEVETSNGNTVRAKYIVSAVGCLSLRNAPGDHFKGLDDFEGDWYHTGAWPHDGVDFTGKRVGLIGTGSTGIQATPVIAAEADHLTVFQRTANFSIPARNAPLSAEETAEIKAHYDDIRDRCRNSSGGFPFHPSEVNANEVTDAERAATFERLWDLGGFRFLAESYADLTIDEFANGTAANFIAEKIHEIVKDPDVAAELVPFDHPYGTKRPPIDTDYYDTYNRDNVKLVNVRKAPIEEITASGVRTTEAEYPLDVIVFATGFDAMTGALLDIDVRGRGGRTLGDAWEAGPRTYLGLQVAGFPNLFTITGPGSPSVLTNMPVAIEQHVDWVTECIQHMENAGHQTIEANDDAQEAWVTHVAEAAEETLFPKANSWYVGANVPGKSRVFMPYVAGLDVYREKCDEVVANDYEGFEIA